MNSRQNRHHRFLKAIFATVFLAGIGFTSRPVAATQLTAKVAGAFDQYVHAAEAASNEDLAAHRNFLYIDALPQPEKNQAYAELQHRQILIQHNNRCASSHCASIPGGLIHDWTGLIFVPGVSLAQALSVLQDYSRDSTYYQPQVVKSKLLEKSGGDFVVSLRLKQVEVITVILDTQYRIHYTRLDRAHVYSRSYSTRIAEVENAGTPQERAIENDHGFLWRLDSYWHFHQAEGGVYIQCRAISLTRDVPAGFAWLFGSFIEKIPAKSLRITLSETRAALLDQFHREKGGSTVNTKQMLIGSIYPSRESEAAPASSAPGIPAFNNARRIQESVTAAPERKLLLWLAARMPAKVNSDHLTLLGSASMFFAGASYALARWNSLGLLFAIFFLALNWFGDSLDGTLARVRNCQRPRYGFYVDHLIDSVGAIFLMAGLAVSHYIDWRIAAGMLIAFLLLSIETYLATYTLGAFRMSFGKFGPTEIRLLLALGNFGLWLRPSARVPELSWRVFDLGGLIAIAGMLLMFVVAAIVHTRTLYHQETQR